MSGGRTATTRNLQRVGEVRDNVERDLKNSTVGGSTFPGRPRNKRFGPDRLSPRSTSERIGQRLPAAACYGVPLR